METLSGLLGGLGVLGIVVSVVLAFVVLLFLPWWAIIDCVLSRRSGGAKAVVVVFLVLTWGLGSIVYGLFLPTSRVLRAFTVVAVLGFGLVFVPSMISLLTGAGLHSSYQAEESRRELQEIVSRFQPATIPTDAVGAFHALHFTYDDFGPATAALARFTLAGPDYATARDTDRGARHVAYDREDGRCFVLTSHEFGTITPSTGRFTKIEIDPSLGDFSWPKGIAFDRTGRQIYVMTSHVFTRFYRFDPRTSDWERLPTEIRDLPLVALAHSATDGLLYGIEARSGARALDRIHRFNTAGASLGAVDLQPAIPVPDGPETLVQLHESDGKLVVVLPSLASSASPAGDGELGSSSNRIFVVDPVSGEVFRPAPSEHETPGPNPSVRQSRVGSSHASPEEKMNQTARMNEEGR
jgi:DNA-binding beta-propeller fold protein YncE